MRYMDDGMRAWIMQTARKNYWRVAPWIELEDLIQDGYLCYCKCRARYTELFTEDPPHPSSRKRFMALVMATYTNHIHSLARTRSPELAEARLAAVDGEPVDLESLAPGEPEAATLHTAISKLPADLTKVLKTLCLKDTGMYKRERRKGSRRLFRETNEEHIRRVMGLAADFDVFGQLREHFAFD